MYVCRRTSGAFELHPALPHSDPKGQAGEQGDQNHRALVEELHVVDARHLCVRLHQKHAKVFQYLNITACPQQTTIYTSSSVKSNTCTKTISKIMIILQQLPSLQELPHNTTTDSTNPNTKYYYYRDTHSTSTEIDFFMPWKSK